MTHPLPGNRHMTALQQHIQEIELYGSTLLSSVLDADQVSAHAPRDDGKSRGCQRSGTM